MIQERRDNNVPSSVNEYAMLSYDEEQVLFLVCREEYLNIIGGNIIQFV